MNLAECPVTASGTVTSLQSIDAAAGALVKDLHQPQPAIFWTDLPLTAAAGWICFGAAVLTPPTTWGFALALTGASLLLYRALCFIHELSHIRRSALPGFETAWNLLVGVPLLMPSIVYVGVHQDHHGLSSYGTDQDPEYLPFARSRLAVVAFLLQSLLIPAFLLLRFLILPWVGFVSSAFQRWLVRHASSLSMNVKYERKVNDAILSRFYRWQIVILAFWGAAAYLAASYSVGWRVLIVWYVATALASFVNTVRTLGAHGYETSGEPRTRIEQLADSIDTPGGPWTELWAPVGLRYHALHHYFPGIPYHNLGQAYRRLTGERPPYRVVSSRSIAASLRRLLRLGAPER